MNDNRYGIDYLLDLLVKNGLIGLSQAGEIKRAYQAALGPAGRPVRTKEGPSSALDPLNYLVSLNLMLPGDNTLGRTVDDDILARVMAHAAGLPYRRVEQRDLDLELVTGILPQSFALRHMVMPLGLENGQLMVGVRHPFCQQIMEDVRRVADQPTQMVIVPTPMLRKLISEVYNFRGSVVGAEGQ
ncbi:MAG: hypothetical protein LBV79_01470, partial [Candidatus Adiutrix sp.]|nr:hypothetical protein [Candidatus Adiutrix sp.]